MPEPIQDEYRAAMNLLAKALDDTLKPAGFCLLVFPLNTSGGVVNYVSNANRDDLLVAMKEFIARAEGRMVDEPGHG